MSNKLAMNAGNGNGIKFSDQWHCQVKLDGWRIFALKDRDVRMYVRSGNEKTGKMPLVENWLKSELPPETVLDGEMVVLSREGGDWGSVASILGANERVSDELTYVVFDVLQCKGLDLRSYEIEKRREILEKIIPNQGPVRICPQTNYSLEAVDIFIANGLEGAIVKAPKSKYLSGTRGKGWWKIKPTLTEDVVVMGSNAGKNSFSDMIGSLIFGQYVNGKLTECGNCSGMNIPQRIEFTKMRDNGTLNGIVIEVAYLHKMPSGGWRHPQFQRIRLDKKAKECKENR